MKCILLIAICYCILSSCSNKNSKFHEVEVTSLSDQEYPDNPDIGFRSKDYKTHLISAINLEKKGDTAMKLIVRVSDEEWIRFNHVDLLEFIPTIPEHIKKDEYLSLLAVVNQEWNRNQVRFSTSDFRCSDSLITRVDIARNCLNSYLWEIIVYRNEGDKILPYTHTWFDFPKGWYQKLFLLRNDIPFSKYSDYLENWKDPVSKELNFGLLSERIQKGEMKISVVSMNDTMYPLEGARLKKYKEIINPINFNTMNDLQSDSTLFATFSVPGFYNTRDPRKTQLGRIDSLLNLDIYKTISLADGKLYPEFHFTFLHSNKQDSTLLYLGGISLGSLPDLEELDAVKGWKNSMGFSNHTFYETVKEHNQYSSLKSPYYAYLTDKEGRWLDSHKVGIDGPIMYWDQDEKLHIWLLSFERHALVGHYIVEFLD